MDGRNMPNDGIEARKALIRRYYVEMWNRWDFELADELIAESITFRGSLGVSVAGRDEFKEYMRTVQQALPDFRNHIEELIGEGDKVVARLTYTGTHEGLLFGIAPTGKKVSYGGVAFFRISGHCIAEGWVLGDRQGLIEQLTEQRY
jgi:steroid delta-isomerase-like uncharacterized protein